MRLSARGGILHSVLVPGTKTLARHRLTLDAYLALAAEQGGVCAICRHADSDRALFIDHDRVCCGPSNRRRTCGNCTRGLLCSGCNGWLGQLELGQLSPWRAEHRPDWFTAARAYLHAAGCDPDAPYRRLVLGEHHQQRMAALGAQPRSTT